MRKRAETNRSTTNATYKDAKGRKRWRRNDDVAEIVRQLGNYLIVGGYPEDHAKRYAKLAHTISRHPELIDTMAENQQLDVLPGVGGVIAQYLDDIVRTGTTSKFQDDQYGPPPPLSVLELTSIPRLGPITARDLYQNHSIDSLASLCDALADGRLMKITGIGPKMIETVKSLCLGQVGPAGSGGDVPSVSTASSSDGPR